MWKKIMAKGKQGMDYKQAGKDAIFGDPDLEQKYAFSSKPRSMGFRVVNK